MKKKTKKKAARRTQRTKQLQVVSVPRTRSSEDRCGMSWDRPDVAVCKDEGLAMMPGVNFYIGKDGDVWWRILSRGRGRRILDASPEGYRRLSGAQNGLRRAREILNDE